MTIKTEFDAKDFQVGALVGRFHVDELHEGHKALLDYVISKHKKVILFLGVTKATSKKNPLDYATRKAMVQSEYPDIVILPIVDQRYNKVWSSNLDAAIGIPFGEKKTLIYGSRDSFIPSYKGKNKTVELEPSVDYSGTAVREAIAGVSVNSIDFRKGAIYAIYNGKRETTFPTVDICAYNDKGQFLMAKKPNEPLWRFVGGFVDRTDASYEVAANREFYEETGGNARLGELTYICSQQIDDWRYRDSEDGIMTTLFLARHAFGNAVASDDLANGGDVKWIDIKEFSNYDGVRTKVMPEHRELMLKLVDKIYSGNLVPNLGERLAERTDKVEYTIE